MIHQIGFTPVPEGKEWIAWCYVKGCGWEASGAFEVVEREVVRHRGVENSGLIFGGLPRAGGSR